jgi:hypothetical protein
LCLKTEWNGSSIRSLPCCIDCPSMFIMRPSITLP